MKAYIKLTEDNFVESITFTPYEDFIEVDNLTSEVIDNLELYKYTNGVFLFDDSRVDYNQRSIDLLKKELEEIIQWLNDNDWIINKVFLAEWEPVDQRFVDYKNERANKRNRRDEILSILEGNK